MTRRILWIEDSAYDENTRLAVPLYLSGKYDLHIALTASDGIRALQHQEFEAVVVDIRLAPGDDSRWVDIYYRLGSSGKTARLGLRLLKLVLGTFGAEWGIDFPATAHDPIRYGILTVESWNDIAEEVRGLGVTVYSRKSATDARILLTVVEQILSNRVATAE